MSDQSISIPVLNSPRLRLEPLSMDHSVGMFAMWQQAAVQEYSGPAQDEFGVEISLPAQSRQDSDRLISFWLKAARDGWGFRWAILRSEDNAFVGHVGFNSLDVCSEIAYHMNPVFWGRGLMTEAAGLAIDWRIRTGANEIEAFIEPENAGSVALALRLSMRPTSEFSDGARRYLLSPAVIDAGAEGDDNRTPAPGSN